MTLKRWFDWIHPRSPKPSATTVENPSFPMHSRSRSSSESDRLFLMALGTYWACLAPSTPLRCSRLIEANDVSSTSSAVVPQTVPYPSRSRLPWTRGTRPLIGGEWGRLITPIHPPQPPLPSHPLPCARVLFRPRARCFLSVTDARLPQGRGCPLGEPSGSRGSSRAACPTATRDGRRHRCARQEERERMGGRGLLAERMQASCCSRGNDISGVLPRESPQ